MSSFGQGQEAGEGFVNKQYTGVENFRVTHVCPTHEELKAIYGDGAKEDTYVLQNDQGKAQVKLVFYIDNEPEEGEPHIKTKLTYFVTKEPRLTNDGSKTQHINVFGKTAWLQPDATKAESGNYEIVGAKGTYVFEGQGARPAFNGEENLIGMLRNLLNLPSLAKAEKPEYAMSQFSVEDWNAMFSGNFAALKAIVTSSPNKIGLLLGVKTVDNGNMYQDVYNRGTLRAWAKNGRKFDYLRDEVNQAKSNGAYPNTDFGPQDYALREYAPDAVPTQQAALANDTGDMFNDDMMSQFGG